MDTAPNAPTLTSRQERYFALIDKLLDCPNGEEPTVLDAESDLLDADFVEALVQTASYFAHHDNGAWGQAGTARMAIDWSTPSTSGVDEDDTWPPHPWGHWIQPSWGGDWAVPNLAAV